MKTNLKWSKTINSTWKRKNMNTARKHENQSGTLSSCESRPKIKKNQPNRCLQETPRRKCSFFVTRKTDKQTLHHNIYIIIFQIVLNTISFSNDEVKADDDEDDFSCGCCTCLGLRRSSRGSS